MRIEIPLLPLAFMNEDHLHASNLIETMKAVLAAYNHSREPLATACRAFLEHNREHFAREEAAMLATGFPPYLMHKREHDRALAWLEGLAIDIAAGLDVETVTQAIELDIPTWFIQHIQTMDRATAAWISSREPASSVCV